MWIEYAVYIITFIITSGLAALGILLSFQLYQQDKKPVMSILLYQQIFLFSFLIYSIWGNAVLRIIISDLKLSEEISSKLAFFVPMIGIPFMIVSWFMLMKFSFLLNGFTPGKLFPLIFFPVLLAIIFGIDILAFREVVIIPDNADLFVVRILAGINILMNTAFLVPFLIRGNSKSPVKKNGFGTKYALLYFAAALTASVVMSFFNVFGYISEAVSIVMVFAAGLLLPLLLRLKYKPENAPAETGNMHFEAFCTTFEISKREAEIIIEICNGKSNKSIADKLFITLQTVKDHNHRIFTKTGVKSRVQLANLVREKTRQV